MHLYVATDGNDSNDGLTPETPLASTQAAEDKLPWPARGRHAVDYLGAGLFEQPGFFVKGGSEAAINGVSYRGSAAMVTRTPTQGPQAAELLEAEALHDGKTRLGFASGGWAESAQLGWRLRVIRDGKKVLFILPAARNGSDYVDLDVGRMLGGGTHTASLLQPGDVCDWVKPAIEFRSQPGGPELGLNFAGAGAGFSAYSETVPGGVNGHTFENIAFQSAVFSRAHGVSFANCDFQHTDNNFIGGSAFFLNCSSRGMQFQGNFCNEHDQPSLRPDSANSPIHQGIDAPSMELMVVGCFRVGRGGAMSALGASYLAEKNVSIYDATGGRPALSVYRGSFVANPPSVNRNRIVCLQGDGNGIGVRCSWGGLVRVNADHDAPLVTGSTEVSLEGANPETWADFLSAPFNGDMSNTKGGRITTGYPT